MYKVILCVKFGFGTSATYDSNQGNNHNNPWFQPSTDSKRCVTHFWPKRQSSHSLSHWFLWHLSTRPPSSNSSTSWPNSTTAPACNASSDGRLPPQPQPLPPQAALQRSVTNSGGRSGPTGNSRSWCFGSPGPVAWSVAMLRPLACWLKRCWKCHRLNDGLKIKRNWLKTHKHTFCWQMVFSIHSWDPIRFNWPVLSQEAFQFSICLRDWLVSQYLEIHTATRTLSLRKLHLWGFPTNLHHRL